jgi:hypothetical protein
MSKYQTPYNQARKKEIQIMIPEIDDEIRDYETAKRNATNPDVRKALDAKIKALKIKKQSYRAGDPVKESQNLDEARKGLDAIKMQWIAKIGGDKSEVTKFVNDQVKELEDRYKKNYGAIVGTLKKILMKKYDISLEEEAQGAVTTSSIGASTMTTSDGATVPAMFGNSSIVPSHMGIVSRRGSYKAPKKNKKNKIREFKEYYFQND